MGGWVNEWMDGWMQRKQKLVEIKKEMEESKKREKT